MEAHSPDMVSKLLTVELRGRYWARVWAWRFVIIQNVDLQPGLVAEAVLYRTVVDLEDMSPLMSFTNSWSSQVFNLSTVSKILICLLSVVNIRTGDPHLDNIDLCMRRRKFLRISKSPLEPGRSSDSDR